MDVRDQWEIVQEWSKIRTEQHSGDLLALKAILSVAVEINLEISKKSNTVVNIVNNIDIPEDQEKYFDNKINATSFRAISFIKASLINFENGGPVSVNDALHRIITENILLVRFLLLNRDAIPDWNRFRKLKDFHEDIPPEFNKFIKNKYERFGLSFLLRKLAEDKKLKESDVMIYKKDIAYLDSQIHPSHTGLDSDLKNQNHRNYRILHRTCQFFSEWSRAMLPLIRKYNLSELLRENLVKELKNVEEHQKVLQQSFEQELSQQNIQHSVSNIKS